MKNKLKIAAAIAAVLAAMVVYKTIFDKRESKKSEADSDDN